MSRPPSPPGRGRRAAEDIGALLAALFVVAVVVLICASSI